MRIERGSFVDMRENMQIVIVGHVDHGKSTIVGRLLVDTGSVTDGKLAHVKGIYQRDAKSFDYSLLLDVLREEQAQKITIDVARCFLNTKKRNYIIIDAPGHTEFLKNMVTGAARAEAALLVIDASEGIQENSRRHGYMLSFLGIKQIAVMINKMDLVDYSKLVFNAVAEEYLRFLKKIGIEPTYFVPVSGANGDNITALSENMPWYRGKTALEVLDDFEAVLKIDKQPFRMPVQDVYDFSDYGDFRRIIAGTAESGVLRVNDKVVFYPSGKASRVKSIEGFNDSSKSEVKAGYSTGFTLTELTPISRGDLATIADQQKPLIAKRIMANIFWLGKKPLRPGKEYIIKLGTARIKAHLKSVVKVIDASSLIEKTKNQVDKNDVAKCIFELDQYIAFDPPELLVQTSRFVIIDNYDITGGGIVEQAF